MIESFTAILLLALVHLLTSELRRIEATHREALISAGSGASLAYVLLSILPKLAEKQYDLMASADTGMRGFLEHHAYLVALVGLVVFYGVSRIESDDGEADLVGSTGLRKLALITTAIGYAAYSVLIGYLIAKRETFGLFSIGLIAVGMGMLFLVSDHGLYKKWPVAYQRWIRWVLIVSLLGGWAVGVWFEASANVVALWYALLAGMMLITTLGEKLSLEKRGSFRFFVLGVVVFTTLLLILEGLGAVAA